MVWVGKDLPAQPCPWPEKLSPGCSKRTQVMIYSWKTCLCSSQHKTIPFFLRVSQAKLPRVESSVTAGTGTATPHVTSPHSCSQRAGDRLGASPCWVTFPAGNGLGRTHLFPPQAPGQCCVQGSCRIFPLILNRC